MRRVSGQKHPPMSILLTLTISLIEWLRPVLVHYLTDPAP